MENTSPFLAIQRAEAQLRTVLRSVDTDTLTADEKKALSGLRRLATDARLDVRDYELSETREEQLQNAVEAKNRIFKLQALIVAAGSVFGPADVAQLSAQLEQITSRLI